MNNYERIIGRNIDEVAQFIVDNEKELCSLRMPIFGGAYSKKLAILEYLSQEV